MNLLIVEDSPGVAEQLRAQLSAVAAVNVVAAVASEDRALEAMERSSIDFAVIDLQLAGGTGFGPIRRLRSCGHPCCIVVLTNHAVPALKIACFEAGADYFLDKSRDFNRVAKIAFELATVTKEVAR